MRTDEQFEFSDVPQLATAVIKVHSRSFYLASLFLPRSIRREVVRLYAWCRWCDDAVDKAPTLDIARERLQALRQDIHRLDQGSEPLQKCSHWLADVKRAHDLPSRLCHDLLDGMEMDAAKTEIQTEQDLLLYCYRAAGSVGLMMSRLLGVGDARANVHAKSLGIAMQLTNIARDIGEDRRMGRCYIPSEWWRDGSEPVNQSTVKQHVEKLLRLADQHYRVGSKGFVYLHWRSRLAIRSAAMLYQEIGSEIARNNYDTITQRAAVPWHRKLRVVLRSVAAEMQLCMRQRFRSVASKMFRSPNFPGESLMNSEARYIVSLGLSLTLIMATALFALVGVNPKDSSYQALPWIYAVISALTAVVFGFLAKRFQEQLEGQILLQSVPVREKNDTK